MKKVQLSRYELVSMAVKKEIDTCVSRDENGRGYIYVIINNTMYYAY